MPVMLCSGNAQAAVIGNRVHILKWSDTRFRLQLGDKGYQYCCLCPGCDRGLQPDVEQVVKMAMADHGVTEAVVRNPQQSEILNIPGLAVFDPEKLLGDAGEGASIIKLEDYL